MRTPNPWRSPHFQHDLADFLFIMQGSVRRYVNGVFETHFNGSVAVNSV